jgi:hypothetical protein
MKNKTITGYKVIKWFNSKTLEIEYGIDCLVNRRWYHLNDGSSPMIYKTEKEARAKLKSLAIEAGVI